MGAVVQPAAEYTPKLVDGFWRQRFTRRVGAIQTHPRWFKRERGIIQGYITIGRIGADACVAVLMAPASGAWLDSKVLINGAYLFEYLAPGDYAVVIIDTLGRWRGKVIHTVVPAP